MLTTYSLGLESEWYYEIDVATTTTESSETLDVVLSSKRWERDG